MGIRPDIHPTIEFRSAWEANFARVLNKLRIKWAYEPQRFFLSNSMSYLPDFRLDSPNPWKVKWIEIKGIWNYGDKAKLRYFMTKHPNEKLKVIARKEYMRLAKKYKDTIPEWESAAKKNKEKKANMKKVENNRSETKNLGKIPSPHGRAMIDAELPLTKTKLIAEKVKKNGRTNNNK